MSTNPEDHLVFVSVELVPTRTLRHILGGSLRLMPKRPSPLQFAGTRHYPFHLTLNFTVALPGQLTKICKSVRRTSYQHQAVHVNLTQWSAYTDGSLAIAVEKTASLTRLHNSIAVELGQLERPICLANRLRGYFTPGELSRFLRVGDPYALDKYSPHITVARYSCAAEARRVSRLLPTQRGRARLSEVRIRTWKDEGDISQKLLTVRLLGQEI